MLRPKEIEHPLRARGHRQGGKRQVHVRALRHKCLEHGQIRWLKPEVHQHFPQLRALAGLQYHLVYFPQRNLVPIPGWVTPWLHQVLGWSVRHVGWQEIRDLLADDPPHPLLV